MSVKYRGDLYIEEVNDMRINRRWFVAMVILFLPLLVVGNAYGESRHRWDIPHLSLSNGVATVSDGLGGITGVLTVQ